MNKKMLIMNKCVVLLFSVLILHHVNDGMLLYAQEESRKDIADIIESIDTLVLKSTARFDFYQGVSLYNSGSIAESLIAFQRAMAQNMDNNDESLLFRYWFSLANLAYGIPSLAESVWRELIVNNYQASFLRAKLEIAQLKSQNIDVFAFDRLVRAFSLDLSTTNYRYPSSIRVLSHNNLLLTAVGSNSVGILSSTGKILSFLQKNVVLLNRPTDAVQLSDGTLLVTEFASDSLLRFSSKGDFMGSFLAPSTDKGTDLKQFIGPQFLTVDDLGNIYVSVYGSARIFKFSSSGEVLLQFGNATEVFSGLFAPTGISVLDKYVWVADRNHDQVYLHKFDTSGNFIDSISLGSDPIESIRAIDGRSLLITFYKKVVRFDVNQEIITGEFSDSDFDTLVSANFDDNGMLWIADYGRNRLEAFSNVTGQYTGLDLKITSVHTENFPQILVKVNTKTSLGGEVSGLDRSAFSLFEGNTPAQDLAVVEEYTLNEDYNTVIIPNFEGGDQSNAINQRITESVNIIAKEGERRSGDGVPIKFWVISASNPAQYLVRSTSAAYAVTQALRENTTIGNRSIVKTFRFAVNTLLPISGKKSIIYIGTLPDDMDNEIWQNLHNIAQFHNIKIFWVRPTAESTMSGTAYSSGETTLRTIISESDGGVYQYPYIVDGLVSSLFDSLQDSISGTYVLSYRSRYDTSPEMQYVPLTVTGYFFTRSGRDIGGYVLPGWGQ